jgi:hypothetical protein
MKKLVVLLLLGGVVVSWGIMVGQFGDTSTFVEGAKGIVIADCLAIPTNKVVIIGGHQVIESFSDGSTLNLIRLTEVASSSV